MPAGRMRALRRALRLTLVLGLSAPLVTAGPSAEALEPTLTLAVAAEQAAVRPGSAVPVSIEVTNGSELPSEAGSLELRISEAPLGEPAAVESWVAGTVASGRVAARSSLLPVPAGGTTTTRVTLPASAIPGEGVWGIAAEASVGGTRLLGHAVVTVKKAAAPAAVAMVFALSSAQPAVGLYSQSQLATLFEPNSPMQSGLSVLAGQTVTVGIDPRLIASIRRWGADAPVAAQEWLKRLETAGLDDFLLQYGDADPALEAQAGLSRLIQPGFTDLPLTEEERFALLNWPSDRQLLWPVYGVRNADLDVFRASGNLDVLLSSTDVVDAARPITTVHGMSAVIAQAEPSRALERALAASDGLAWQSASHVLQAELSFFSGRTVVLAPNRVDMGNPLRARALLTTLARSTVSQVVPLASIASSGETTLRERATSADVVATASHLVTRAAAVTAFAGVASTPQTLIDANNRDLLALLSSDWRADRDSWKQAAAGFDATVASTLSAVRVVTSSTVNVLARETSLPVTVENNLATSISVRVSASPNNGRLLVGEAPLTIIPASSRETVRIPVTSRIGNGPVTITVSVQSATGRAVAEPVVIAANVQADWEGWGAFAVALAVGALFVIGIVRQVRKVRRSRRGVDA